MERTDCGSVGWVGFASACPPPPDQKLPKAPNSETFYNCLGVNFKPTFRVIIVYVLRYSQNPNYSHILHHQWVNVSILL